MGVREWCGEKDRAVGVREWCGGKKGCRVTISHSLKNVHLQFNDIRTTD